MIKPSHRLDQVKEYYFSAKLKEVKQLIAEGQPIIPMGIGSPDLPPHPAIIKALQLAAANENAHGYQPYQGSPELRLAMAKFYAEHYGVNLGPSEILPLMGSKEGIMHISMAFLNPGDQVLVPDPGYPTYAAVAHLVHADPVPYKLMEENNWQPDFNSLEALDLSKIKIMWTNYPHMPTGAKAGQNLFQNLVNFGQKHGILIVHDNPYSFILNDKPESILAIQGAQKVALELNSLSKTFNIPGWRVGMVAGSKENLNTILQVKSNMDSGMFSGIQAGAIAALELSNSWLEETNQHYATRRTLIWQLVDTLGLTCEKNAAGMFVWAKLPGNTDAYKYADWLLYDKKIFITPGSIFGPMGENYIRFSLCIEENQILEAIKRVKST
ncbi:pyridoxal phosphate-dependent aminotransferase [Anditalea andensis]|uniref:Aminotransferase n=1 Tax=Anditalea andensis TaxID=1048983 RepID=A0A074L3C7_9BACT|nr:aminotransferase class I/II-fold pyridoxal phosphate-dependent enzyme [Anditalea andensis]KEO74995.1 aminotransferase [Anditalea andensis]